MDSINKRIAERFQPTLDIIQRQTACEHKWHDKHGAAYYRCDICGYLADDKELDRFITIQKMIDKGVSKDDIERLKKYI